MNEVWESPDGKIKKVILVKGKFGVKPTENSHCVIDIKNCAMNVRKYNNCGIVIGTIDGYFKRFLDICVQNMHSGEIAKVSFKMPEGEKLEFVLELKSFKEASPIYQWTAVEKYNLALKHKKHGVELFKQGCYVDASHCFGKALKLLASIPVDIQKPHVPVDGLEMFTIKELEVNLYNNLASCFLKNTRNEVVIELCQKVLDRDKNNIKALYKCGTASLQTHDLEMAKECFQRILELEPDNTVARAQLAVTNVKLTEADNRVNAIFKNMFVQ